MHIMMLYKAAEQAIIMMWLLVIPDPSIFTQHATARPLTQIVHGMREWLTPLTQN